MNDPFCLVLMIMPVAYDSYIFLIYLRPENRNFFESFILLITQRLALLTLQ
jgi:hypothetical protein